MFELQKAERIVLLDNQEEICPNRKYFIVTHVYSHSNTNKEHNRLNKEKFASKVQEVIHHNNKIDIACTEANTGVSLPSMTPWEIHLFS